MMWEWRKTLCIHGIYHASGIIEKTCVVTFTRACYKFLIFTHKFIVLIYSNDNSYSSITEYHFKYEYVKKSMNIDRSVRVCDITFSPL